MSRKLKSIPKAVDRLVKFCELKGFNVVFSDGEESECNPEERKITINEEDEEIKLWTLLHEAGHMQIFELSDYTESFGLIAKQIELPLNARTLQCHYQKLKEEMLAWETGLNIANKLNIYVDIDRYEEHAAECYMSYVYEAARPYYQLEAKEQFAKHGIELEF